MPDHETVTYQRNRSADDRMKLSRDEVSVTPLGDGTFVVAYPDATTQRIHPPRSRAFIAEEALEFAQKLWRAISARRAQNVGE